MMSGASVTARRRTPPLEEARQVGLELVEQHLELGVIELPERGNVGRVHDDGALLLHRRRWRRSRVRRSPLASRRAGSARRRCVRPSQAVRDRAPGVVALSARADGARRVGRVGAASTVSSAAASATVRAIGPAVSWLCAMGTMPVRLTSPTVGLMPDKSVDVRRRHDRPVGFRADSGRREVRRDGYTGPRTRARRIAVERVRVARLPSASRSIRSTNGVERKFAHSLRFVLPSRTAPASRRRWTMKASRGAGADGQARASRRWSASDRRSRCCP